MGCAASQPSPLDTQLPVKPHLREQYGQRNAERDARAVNGTAAAESRELTPNQPAHDVVVVHCSTGMYALAGCVMLPH